MQTSFIFAGFGGQGVMFAGQLLAYAGMDAGLEVTWIPSYGPEMRGGTAHCTVMLSDVPIGSPLVSMPDVVLAFNLPSFDKYAEAVAPGGLLVYNESLVPERCARTDIEIIPLAASAQAEALGNARVLNMVMLGAALRARPVLSIQALEMALAEHMPAHRRHMLEINQAALQAGVAV